MPVGPRQLFGVEHAGALPHILDPESPGKFVERQQFLVLARRPPEQREIVRERFGQVAPLAEFADRGRPVTLGEL